MGSFVAEISSFFAWLLASTMQVSVLICLILAIKAVLRGRLAVRWHYWLWLLLLVRMVSPWAPESSFSVFTLVSQAKKTVVTEQTAKVSLLSEPADVTPKATNLSQGRQSVKPAKTTLQPARSSAGTSRVSFEIIDILSLVWFVVALGLAGFALVCNFRLWRIIKSQRPLTQGKILDLLEDCKAEMGIQTILGLVVTDRVKSPALFGVVRPRLLLPEGMLETLSTEELRYVFLHELGHLKRHDIYLGWLMVVLQVLHWFNPLVWFAFNRMRADRELACDGLVLSTMADDKSQAYGQTLVNLFKGFSGLQYAPGIAGILENKSQLKRRITMIARFKKGSYRWSVLAVVLLAVLSCVALTNAKAANQAAEKKPVALAKEFVRLLVNEKFSAATKNFDATMKKSLPVEKLAETWRTTTGRAGLFKQQLGTRLEKFLGSYIVYVTCEFEKGPMDVKVVYDDKRQVSGLFFIPTPQDVLKSYQERPDKKATAKTTDVAEKQVTKEELEQIVKQAVITISTCSETDSRVAPALKSLQDLDNNAVVKELIKYLDSDRNTIRRSAIYVLWKGNFKSIEPAAGSLQKLCSHDEPYTRGMAAITLGAGKVDSSFEALADMTSQDSDAYARRCAAYALGLMGRAEAKPVLEKALKDSDFNVRNNAEAALTMLSQIRLPKTVQVILKDSLENGTDVPTGWEKGKNVSGVEYIWDKNNGSDGRASLCLKKTANRYFPIAQWTRKIEHKSDASKLAVSAQVKAENATKAVLDALFLDESNKWIKHEWVFYIGRKKEENIPPANHDWKAYSGIVEIPEKTQTVVIGLQIYGPGTVWFDELEVAYVKEPEEVKSRNDKLLAEDLIAEGWKLWRDRKLTQAEEKFKEAILKNPEAEGAYQGLGWAQLNQGKKLNAKDSFEKCVAINPNNAAALNGLGWIAKGQGNINKAIGCWEKAVSAAPNATAALGGLTQTYMERKEYDKAVKYYKMWLAVEPANARAKEGLAKAQAELKDK